MSKNQKDNVNHPSHYETGKFECIEVMLEALGVEFVKHFCICNAFKYIYRHRKKNGDEDIKKAIWYLNRYISLCENTSDSDTVSISDYGISMDVVKKFQDDFYKSTIAPLGTPPTITSKE